MTKTLGEIAYDAAGEKLGSYPGIGEWQHLPEYGKAYWEAAASAIVEECAKVLADKAEALAFEANLHRDSARIEILMAKGQAHAEAAVAIRSLKATPPEAGLKRPKADEVSAAGESASLTPHFSTDPASDSLTHKEDTA